MQVHYGRASFARLSRIPTYFVLGRAQLDIGKCAITILEYAAAPLNPEGMKVLLVFMDQPLLWASKELQQIINNGAKVIEIVLTICPCIVAKELIDILSTAHASLSDYLIEALSEAMERHADDRPTQVKNASTSVQGLWHVPPALLSAQCPLLHQSTL